MASKVQSLTSENKLTSSELKNEESVSGWTEELMPSIKKLRQAIQCLLKTAKLTYSIMTLKVRNFKIKLKVLSIFFVTL